MENTNLFKNAKIESLKNVEMFLKDAELLISKNNSYPHAFALIVLGLEELEKAWGYFFLCDDNFNDTDRLDIIKKLKNHKIKQGEVKHHVKKNIRRD